MKSLSILLLLLQVRHPDSADQLVRAMVEAAAADARPALGVSIGRGPLYVYTQSIATSTSILLNRDYGASDVEAALDRPFRVATPASFARCSQNSPDCEIPDNGLYLEVTCVAITDHGAEATITIRWTANWSVVPGRYEPRLGRRVVRFWFRRQGDDWLLERKQVLTMS